MIPYLKSDVKDTAKEKIKGPTKDVALPENAKKPKNSFSLLGGVSFPIKDLLAAWLGPENMPIKHPDSQNKNFPVIVKPNK